MDDFKVGDKVVYKKGFGLPDCGEGIVSSIYGDLAIVFEDGCNTTTSPDRLSRVSFHPGDLVVHKRRGTVDKIKSLPGMEEYDTRGFTRADEGMILEGDPWAYQKNWQRANIMPLEEGE